MKMLIVDDHPVVLEGLINVFYREGYEVLKATNASSALAISDENPGIDIFIVDLSLQEDTDGLLLISELKRRHAESHVIVYTMHEEMWNISTLENAKVDGIVLKGESISELLNAVSTVKSGGVYRSPVFSERLEAIRNAKGILSERDICVLKAISSGQNTRDIAGTLFITEKGVEYHRRNILKKLGSNNMTHAISRAIKLGIISLAAICMPIISEASDKTPEAIDLGLSVKWADRNLEAPSPLEVGGYYSFGELETKEDYDWYSYEHCDESNDEYGMFNQHEIGDESIAGTAYDVAHVDLGGGWRMPTEEEFEELIEGCEIEYVEAEPLNYIHIVAPNGNYIDIPFAGYMNKENLLSLNKEIDIWTASFYVEAGEEDGFTWYQNCPTVFGFLSKYGAVLVEGSPQLGLQIRPVYDTNVGVEASASLADIPSSIYTVDGRYVGKSLDNLLSGIYIIRYSNGKSRRLLVK